MIESWSILRDGSQTGTSICSIRYTGTAAWAYHGNWLLRLGKRISMICLQPGRGGPIQDTEFPVCLYTVTCRCFRANKRPRLNLAEPDCLQALPKDLVVYSKRPL